MDGSIDSAAALEAGVGRIDDGVSGLLRNVSGLEEDQRA
jgi:hypothetical protein